MAFFGKKRHKDLEDEYLADTGDQGFYVRFDQNDKKDEILAYLECNFRDANLSQTEVADLFGISNYTLSRLFKNKVGIGFSEYLSAKRIECASTLLLTTEYSVSEVAAMSGFSSINYFSKTFKAYVGVTPNQYRNQK